MRLPYAAKQLIKQVKAIDDKAVSSPVGLPDGLGVWRSIGFDETTSGWLFHCLVACQDPRIQHLDMIEDRLTIQFVLDHRADQVQRFYLDEALTVLGDYLGG